MSERLLQFNIQAPISAEDFWTIRMEMSDSLREKIAALSSQQFAAVTHELVESLREYSTDKGMSFPAEALIVSGSKRTERVGSKAKNKRLTSAARYCNF